MMKSEVTPVSMIHLKKSDVPEYLRKGALFEAFDDGSDEFSVPANILKANTLVFNTSDLIHLLSSLQYWAVDDLPLEHVMPFLLDQGWRTECGADDVSKYFAHFPVLEFLIKLQHTDPSSKIAESIAYGSVEVVKYLDEKSLPWPRNASEIAASAGHLAMLKCVLEIDGALSMTTPHAAAVAGHLDCLRFAMEYGGAYDTSTMPYSVAQRGHLDCLKYLHSRNVIPLDVAMTSCAAQSGSVACLDYLRGIGCPCEEMTVYNAAKFGHLEVLQYLYSHDIKGTETACEQAAEGGHLECLQYLHSVNCPWNNRCSFAAAVHNRLDILKFLHTHNCPRSPTTIHYAAQNGHFECVQFLNENGCVCETGIYSFTLRSQDFQLSHFDCLMYFHTQNCPVDKNECIEAAISVRHSLSFNVNKVDVLARCDEYLIYLQQLE